MSIPLPPNMSCQQHLSDDLIVGILLWLLVKTLSRLRCVQKTWNTLISSDHSFIKLHLQTKASQDPHLLLQSDYIQSYKKHECSLVPIPVSCLVENASTALPTNPHNRFENHRSRCNWLIGSCNGLICLHGHSFNNGSREDWLYFWNPATRLISKNLGSFHAKSDFFRLTFGYDNSSDTYKVVLFDFGYGKRKIGEASQGAPVKVFTLGDNIWSDIQNISVATLHDRYQKPNEGVNLSGTLNWIALHESLTHFYDPQAITVEQLLILSLDLGTETYNHIPLPSGFDEVPCVEPNVVVLMDCLCFCHVWKKTHFIIWQMKEFKVEKSWTQLVKISYQDLGIKPLTGPAYHYKMLPLCLYNDHTLILAGIDDYQATLFHMRDNIPEATRIKNDICWLSAVNYIESLVSPHLKFATPTSGPFTTLRGRPAKTK